MSVSFTHLPSGPHGRGAEIVSSPGKARFTLGHGRKIAIRCGMAFPGVHAVIKSLAKVAGATTLGLAALVAAPTASAAIVTGSWDPILPSPFENLGWVATVNLQVADDCVLNATSSISVSIFGNTFGCTATPTVQGFTLLRAQVGIYSTLTGAIVDVLGFAPPAGPMGVSLTGTGGNFMLTLGESNTEQGKAAGTLGYGFRFEVPGALPVLSYQDNAVPGEFFTPVGSEPILTDFSSRPDEELEAVLASTALAVGQIVAAPTAVPEPGSLALTLLALGASGAARRTRRAA